MSAPLLTDAEERDARALLIYIFAGRGAEDGQVRALLGLIGDRRRARIAAALRRAAEIIAPTAKE